MSVYIFDSEWTDRKNPEIIEAAWLQLQNGRYFLSDNGIQHARPLVVERKFVQRYKPERPISFGAMTKHHIFAEDLADQPPSTSFRLPVDTRFLIGHSIDEDWKACLNTVGREILGEAEPFRICTHAMATHVWEDADSFSLVGLLYMLEGSQIRELTRHAHGAQTDTELCKILLEHILKAKPDVTTWDDLWRFSEASRIPIYCPFKNREGVKLVDLDDSYIDWCLSQGWIDPYLRKGLENVLRDRGHLGDDSDDDSPEPDDEYFWEV